MDRNGKRMRHRQRTTRVLVAVAGIVLAVLAFRHFRPATVPDPAAPDNEIRRGTAHDDHGDVEEGHEGHDGHGEERAVRLADAGRKEFGIEIGMAGPGKIKVHVVLPGEVVINADRLAHIVPPVPGVVREVRRNLGDRVRKGDVLAVLDSRDLADAKAAFLNAAERAALARARFAREEDLWKKKISAEQDYLEAGRALSEAAIALRSAEQKLHAIGFSDEYLKQLPSQPDMSYTRLEIAAPFEGTVIEKHISLGEALKEDAAIFTIADLSTVWVNLSVYQKDLPYVRKGQPVVVSAGQGIPDAPGTVSYIGPLIGEQTRTAVARVVLPNRDGRLRPGLFVTGSILVESVPVAVAVPKASVQTVDEQACVFVEAGEEFVLRPVTLGRSNETHVEITAGLPPGTRYVTSGAFTLKAELSKGAFGDSHAH